MCDRGMGSSTGSMDQCMKGTGIRVNLMAWGSLCTQMGTLMMANGKITRQTGRGSIPMPTGIFIAANGKTTFKMGLVKKSGKTGLHS